MDIQQIKETLQIRYAKLSFEIRFLEDTKLPKYKESALRGGIGEMLLRSHCIRDRKCENCDFKKECIVCHTMYCQFEKKPNFVTTGESAGYVFECWNYQEYFHKGEVLKFQLILFGKTIVHFSHFLQAICQLGIVGLGRYQSRYEIVSIKNTFGEDILEGQDICMYKCRVQTVWDYVCYRMERDDLVEGRICFKTPVSIKYHGEFQEYLSIETLIPPLLRRIWILDCFEGLPCEEIVLIEPYPETLREESRMMNIWRYSGTQERKMALRGVKGDLWISGVSDEMRLLLLAGELIHIGKNTSFGFGKYVLK